MCGGGACGARLRPQATGGIDLEVHGARFNPDEAGSVLDFYMPVEGVAGTVLPNPKARANRTGADAGRLASRASP